MVPCIHLPSAGSNAERAHLKYSWLVSQSTSSLLCVCLFVCLFICLLVGGVVVVVVVDEEIIYYLMLCLLFSWQKSTE